jgi:hypothetical protein
MNCTSVGCQQRDHVHNRTAQAPKLSKNTAMNTQHQTSFTKAIIGSTQRLIRSSKNNLLASHHIDAHTMKDIGINQLGWN